MFGLDFTAIHSEPERSRVKQLFLLLPGSLRAHRHA